MWWRREQRAAGGVEAQVGHDLVAERGARAMTVRDAFRCARSSRRVNDVAEVICGQANVGRSIPDVGDELLVLLPLGHNPQRRHLTECGRRELHERIAREQQQCTRIHREVRKQLGRQKRRKRHSHTARA